MSAAPQDLPDEISVLVVDDDVDFRQLLRLQLDLNVGISVIGVAGDGQDAIEQVERLAPDAVVMDLLMPRMNGFEAIEYLANHHPDVGVVAFSAVAGQYARAQCERLGVDLVLKSGDIRPLVGALKRAARPAL